MKSLASHFFEKGWAVIDMVDPSPIYEARELLKQELASILGRTIELENYHEVALDDAQHTETQVKLTQFFRDKKLGRKVIEAQKDIFRGIIGLDLLVQAFPYLRMTRPNKPQDNIGYHRDTFYGGSPFEVSVLVPFVNLESKSGLSVMSGSQTAPESMFPIEQIKNPDTAVVKGSAKHQLGFLYAPKLMDPEIEKQMTPIPLKLGQALMFSLSTVHGSVVNTGRFTRWSSDIRVVNALAPVDLSARPTYYETLCLSPVTESARKYLEVNQIRGTANV